MKKPDGGPAFPRDQYYAEKRTGTTDGMSLRDYFAAHALQGLIASNDDGAGDRIEDLPKYAYHIADAMLKARQS